MNDNLILEFLRGLFLNLLLHLSSCSDIAMASEEASTTSPSQTPWSHVNVFLPPNTAGPSRECLTCVHSSSLSLMYISISLFFLFSFFFSFQGYRRLLQKKQNQLQQSSRRHFLVIFHSAMALMHLL